MIHSLCSGYHWSFEQAKTLTLPQIIMLNHAAWVANEKMDRRIHKGERSSERRVEYDEDNLADKDSNDMARYWDGFGMG